MILVLDSKNLLYYEVLILSTLDKDWRELGMLRAAGGNSCVAFITPLQSGCSWHIHRSWNVYTCQVSINRDTQNISPTDFEQNS